MTKMTDDQNDFLHFLTLFSACTPHFRAVTKRVNPMCLSLQKNHYSYEFVIK